MTARRGDDGYDAPYALVIFAVLGIACAIVAIVSWRQPGHTTATMAFYGAFFLANACSFLYTTRRGKCQVWDEILDGLRAEDERAAADRGHGARRFPVLGEERESVRVLHDGHAAGDDVYRQQQLHGRIDVGRLRLGSIRHSSQARYPKMPPMAAVRTIGAVWRTRWPVPSTNSAPTMWTVARERLRPVTS